MTIVTGMAHHLVGPHEIRMRLGGISRQRVYEITHYSHFPAPVADLVFGKVWLADDVEAWIREHRPGDHRENWPALRPGRPATRVDGPATATGVDRTAAAAGADSAAVSGG